MRVFFSASREGQKYFNFYYEMILNSLNKEGYDNVNKEYLKKKHKKVEEKLVKKNINEFNILYKKQIKKINNADVCIFECSFRSLTIGYLLKKALELNKPVIGLYLKENIPDFLIGLGDDRLQMVEYNKDNLADLLKTSIQKASFLTDKRFNFFISSSLLAYLNKTAKKLGITKSTFIRNLIEEYKKTNP